MTTPCQKPCEQPYAPGRQGKLVLRLQRGTAIRIGENIRIEWVEKDSQPRLAIYAPQGMKITRVNTERKPR